MFNLKVERVRPHNILVEFQGKCLELDVYENNLKEVSIRNPRAPNIETFTVTNS